MFVAGKLFQPRLTSTLAYYENPLFTDKKIYDIGPWFITKYFFVINLNIRTIYNDVKWGGCLPFTRSTVVRKLGFVRSSGLKRGGGGGAGRKLKKPS